MSNDKPVNPFMFVKYDKISDFLLWFSDGFYLKFNVRLSKKDNQGYRRPFHAEYSYYNKAYDDRSYMIRRDYSCYYSIECKDRQGIILKPGDIYVLNRLIEQNVLPWFYGDTRIFKLNREGKTCIITRNFRSVNLPLGNGSFLKILPAVLEFQNGDTVEGVRFILDDENNFFDISSEVFFNFCQIIENTDMITMASSMLNYVKTKPYLVNYNDIN